jgi:hypothetical protein
LIGPGASIVCITIRIAHLAFPFLSCSFFGFFCGFPPFNVPMPWCHLLHFGANWLLKAKKKFTGAEGIIQKEDNEGAAKCS